MSKSGSMPADEKPLNHSTLHCAIISWFLKHQRPPTMAELSVFFGCDATTARTGLRALAQDHGVVLQPVTDEIWICHPFSAAPTTCVVASGPKKWWGNCMWCSLGLVHLVQDTCTIETRLGGIGELVTLRVEDGRLDDPDYVVHFPIPMSKAWDNVIYTCSVMLLFRNEAAVEDWCLERGIPKGSVVPVEQVMRFAAAWYAHHADPGWTKWSAVEAADLFERHALRGPIWSLAAEAGRF